MKYKITDEHIQRFKRLYTFSTREAADSTRKALEDFIESIPEPLPTLRPIAEASEVAAEGTVRYYCGCGQWVPSALSVERLEAGTHFIDILLPVESPEDKWRAEFERLAKAEFEQWHPDKFSRHSNGEYFDCEAQIAYRIWKAAKSTPETN